jgi:hypothetical protein
MWLDGRGSMVIEPMECLRILAMHAGGIGRVGFDDEGIPTILPVNFGVAGRDVIFRTDAGSKLTMAMNNQVAAFETDGIDEAHKVAWSVLLRGMAEVISGEQLMSIGFDPGSIPTLVPTPGHYGVRIRGETITGRRFEISDEGAQRALSLFSSPLSWA